jgi:hypothetical protein
MTDWRDAGKQMTTKEMYALAWRFWRCKLYEEDCWDRMNEDEQEDYEEVDSSATHEYYVACQLSSEAQANYIRAGVPSHILMKARRSLSQRELLQFAGKGLVRARDRFS